jgi:hypothetical protein
MKGFHYTGNGGVISHWKQVFAQLDLPPGKYIVFAKAHIAIGSTSDPTHRGYEAILEAGSARDSQLGSLKYDPDDPGSRYESIALNVAFESSREPARATLVVNATGFNRLYAWYPRLSAIQLDELDIQTEGKELDDKKQQSLESDLLASSAHTGFPIEAITKALGW